MQYCNRANLWEIFHMLTSQRHQITGEKIWNTWRLKQEVPGCLTSAATLWPQLVLLSLVLPPPSIHIQLLTTVMPLLYTLTSTILHKWIYIFHTMHENMPRNSHNCVKNKFHKVLRYKRGEHTSQLVMELLTSSTRDAKWRLLQHLELLVLAPATNDVAWSSQ
jgi:hypothetical protein